MGSIFRDTYLLMAMDDVPENYKTKELVIWKKNIKAATQFFIEEIFEKWLQSKTPNFKLKRTKSTG
jgi:hypothetical protein